MALGSQQEQRATAVAFWWLCWCCSVSEQIVEEERGVEGVLDPYLFRGGRRRLEECGSPLRRCTLQVGPGESSRTRYGSHHDDTARSCRFWADAGGEQMMTRRLIVSKRKSQARSSMVSKTTQASVGRQGGSNWVYNNHQQWLAGLVQPSALIFCLGLTRCSGTCRLYHNNHGKG